MLTPRNHRYARVFVLLVAILATPPLVSLPAAGVDAAPAPSVPAVYAATAAAAPSLLRLDGSTLTQKASAAVDYGDVVVLSSDGGTAYVAEGSDLAIVNTRTRAVARVRNVASARTSLDDVVVSPDGRRVYTSDGEEHVAVIDPAKRTVVKRIVVPGADRLLVSLDGAKVYAVGGRPNADSITVINTATAYAKPFSLAQQGDSSTTVEDAALAPDGHTIYAVVSHGSAGHTEVNLEAVDPAAGEATRVAALGNVMFGRVAVSPDGQRVYVAQETLQVVDLTKRPATATKVLDLAAQANSLAFTPGGRQLAVGEWRDGGTPPGTVELVDTATNKVIAHRDVKGGAMGVAVSPDQAPVARLHASAGALGHASTFDASASTVAYGTIASYHWDFGDGSPAATTTTSRASHSYAHAGHFTVRVTATDSVGTSTARVFTGRMMLRNGGPSATTSAVVNVAAHAPAGGPTTPTATPAHPVLAATGFPDIGRNVGIALVCLVAGAGLVVIGRRRYNARHR